MNFCSREKKSEKWGFSYLNTFGVPPLQRHWLILCFEVMVNPHAIIEIKGLIWPKAIQNTDGFYGELIKSPNLLFKKPNWTIIALELAKLNGTHFDLYLGASKRCQESVVSLQSQVLRLTETNKCLKKDTQPVWLSD